MQADADQLKVFTGRANPDLAKKWGVSSLPSIYLCDASKESPEKAVLEKLTGEKKPLALKLAIQKALFKVEKK